MYENLKYPLQQLCYSLLTLYNDNDQFNHYPLCDRADVLYSIHRKDMCFFIDSIHRYRIIDLLTDFCQVIERMEYIVGGTITHQALATVRQEGFGAPRPGVPRIAIVITDGLSRYPAYTRREASLLRDAGITVYSVGTEMYY